MTTKYKDALADLNKGIAIDTPPNTDWSIDIFDYINEGTIHTIKTLLQDKIDGGWLPIESRKAVEWDKMRIYSYAPKFDRQGREQLPRLEKIEWLPNRKCDLYIDLPLPTPPKETK
tara:strand:+ start:366 stop:713 length:348 start_codon:yes stop_codon:yes gene_type:complete